jgi:hypothetical protein
MKNVINDIWPIKTAKGIQALHKEFSDFVQSSARPGRLWAENQLGFADFLMLQHNSMLKLMLSIPKYFSENLV